MHQPRVMTEPILTPATWARGKCPLYTMDPKGLFSARMIRAGWALRVAGFEDDSESMKFVPFKGRGGMRWSLCASSRRKLTSIKPGDTFYPDLVLVIGLTFESVPPLPDKVFVFNYVKWRPIFPLGSTLRDIVLSCPNTRTWTTPSR